MKHPVAAELALYAGGELSLWKRWETFRHLRRCEACRRQANGFAADRGFVADASEQLDGTLNWHQLAAEMRANIRVGLQAGECVAPPERPRLRLGWRAVAALASITLVIVSGWWLHLPRPAVSPEGGLVAATSNGVQVKEHDGALTLLHASAEPVFFSAQTDGAMSVHYVDDETGMVTVNNVYVQ